MTPEELEEIVDRLERLTKVPDDVLCEIVTREGLSFWVFDRDAMPELSGAPDADRHLAAWLCRGCPVIDECLELELRAAGPDTVGVWGGLSDTDRRELYRYWAARLISNLRTDGGDAR